MISDELDGLPFCPSLPEIIQEVLSMRTGIRPNIVDCFATLRVQLFHPELDILRKCIVELFGRLLEFLLHKNYRIIQLIDWNFKSESRYEHLP